jgi:hypothetical protein
MKAKEPAAMYFSRPQLEALKGWIKDNLDHVEDGSLLLKMRDLMQNNAPSQDEILKLSPEIKKRIEKGKEDIREGRYIEDGDIRKRLSKWLES